jgi:hypothetical protein
MDCMGGGPFGISKTLEYAEKIDIIAEGRLLALSSLASQMIQMSEIFELFKFTCLTTSLPKI